MNSKLVLGASGALLGVIGYFLLATGSMHGGSGFNGWNPDFIQLGVLWVWACAGVSIGALLRRLIALKNDRQPFPGIGAVISLTTRDYDFWIGLFAAPVLLGSNLKVLGNPTDAGYIWIAFQNGLLAPVLIGQLLEGKAKEPSKTNPG